MPSIAAAISAAIDIQADFDRFIFKQCVDSNFHPLKPSTEYTEFKTYKHFQAESEKYC